MSARQSLRHRVAVTLALFAGVVSLTLAVVVYLSSHDLEERLIDDTLSAELDDYVARRARNPQSLPERTATIRAFVVSPADDTTVPPEVATLAPGQHKLELEGIPYRAAAREVGDQRYVVLYDTRALKRREQLFLLLLAGSVLLITTIAAVAGHWLAGRVIAPVDELARRVAGLRPEETLVPLAGQFPWVEVQRLAADFDDYLLRLHDFIEREHLFTGDVSHELRTPLAVINGATELLLDDPQLGEKNRQRTARISRAVAEMGEISGALLALAREQEGQRLQQPPCDVVAVATELVERYRELHHGKPVTLVMTVNHAPEVRADRTVLAMVLANLLRNALSYTESGEVRVTLNSHAIVVEDSGVGLGSSDSRELFQPYVRGAQSNGAGLGLSLVKRLCERQGWQVSLANRPEGGTRAELSFSSDSTSANIDTPPLRTTDTSL